MSIKLEVGKKYVNRLGDVHGPLINTGEPSYPFEDESCKSWTENGSYWNDGTSVCDLVSEYVEPIPEEPQADAGIKLEVGKKYIARNGEVYGPLVYFGDPTYPFRFGIDSWTEGGFILAEGLEDELDLMYEYVEPPTVEQPTKDLGSNASIEIERIQAERGERYGSWACNAEFTDNFLDIARSGASWSRMSASQRTAITMTLHKIARMLNGDPDYEDNWVDAISYLDLALAEMRG